MNICPFCNAIVQEKADLITIDNVAMCKFCAEIISHREIEAVLDMATYLTDCDATCTGEFIDYPV